jgi:hypothetical protein
MVFNTALCFLLLAISDFFSRFEWARKAWIAVFLISLLSGLQYLFEIDLGIDQMFVSGPPWNYLTHPGRMPPPSAFSLAFAALAQAAYYRQKASSIFPWRLLSLILSIIVAVLGAAGALYYFAAVSRNIFWGNFAKMSLLTTFSLILVGVRGILEATPKVHFLQKDNRWGALGIAVGLGLFLAVIANWEMKLIENTALSSFEIRKQVDQHADDLREELFNLSKNFQKMQFPESAAAAKARHWNLKFPGAHALIRLSKREPELIWSEQSFNARDLRLLKEQVDQPNSDFRFLESISCQRARWMAFVHQGYLLIFSPQPFITKHFPPQRYLYSLHCRGEILFSNATDLPFVLQDWTVTAPLRLFESDLVIVINPTRQTLADAGSSSFLPYLLAGMSLSLAFGVILSCVPYVRRRFSH